MDLYNTRVFGQCVPSSCPGPSPQVRRCPYVYDRSLGLEYGPTRKIWTHDANEGVRKEIGRGGRVSFTSNFGKNYFLSPAMLRCVVLNVAIVWSELFKPITRRSLSVLSIASVIVVVSVPMQGILPVFFFFYKEAPFMITPPLFFSCERSGMCAIGECCRRVAIFISVYSHYSGFLKDLFTMGLKYSPIFTTRTFASIHAKILRVT